MANKGSTTSEAADAATHDRSWERVKERFHAGQIVQGVVEDVQPYGVFFDIGASFPAFMDILEAPSQPMNVGQEMSLKVVQFADWNKQIRVAPAGNQEGVGGMPFFETPFARSADDSANNREKLVEIVCEAPGQVVPADDSADNRESALAAANELSAETAARIEGEYLKLKQVYESLPNEDQTRLGEAVALLVQAQRQLGDAALKNFHIRLDHIEQYCNESGEVSYCSYGTFVPNMALQAIDAWSHGREFSPPSLFRLPSTKQPDPQSKPSE